MKLMENNWELDDEIFLAIRSKNTYMIDLIIKQQQPKSDDAVKKYESAALVQKRWLKKNFSTGRLQDVSPLNYAQAQNTREETDESKKIYDYINNKTVLNKCSTVDAEFRDDIGEKKDRFTFTADERVEHGDNRTLYCIDK